MSSKTEIALAVTYMIVMTALSIYLGMAGYV
jgi:hypothetical protein